MSTRTEFPRQLVHIGVGAGALLLRWLTWPQAIACAACAILFNALVLPRVGGRALLRAEEGGGTHSLGVLLYPVSVLGLVLAFPKRPDIAAAAWGILAVGDGCATLVGKRWPFGRWPWNQAKTLSGSAALFLAGGAAGALLMWWTGPAVAEARAWWQVGVAPFVAALAAMLVETIDVRLDDNLSVPFTAGLVLWVTSLVEPAAAAAVFGLFVGRLPAGLLVNVVVAVLSLRLRAVSRSGVVGGLIVGISIWAGTGWQGWALLFASFLVATVASRVGLRRKQLLGIEQEQGGRRGVGNALANCLLAAVAAVVGPLTGHADAALVAFVAALVTGASDTAASEIGKAWGRVTWSPTTFARVAPGSIGGMSLEGTTAGLATAAGLAAAAVALGLLPGDALWIIVVAAGAAMLLESVLGATLEPRGIVNNDLLNFIDTLAAASVALCLHAWMTA